jgi:hypothetical protein
MSQPTDHSGSGAGSTVDTALEAWRKWKTPWWMDAGYEYDCFRAGYEAGSADLEAERKRSGEAIADLVATGRALEAAQAEIERLKNADDEARQHRETIGKFESMWTEQKARMVALERVIEGVRNLIADDHMFPTSDDAAWGVVTHHWQEVQAALAALDAADAAKEPKH